MLNSFRANCSAQSMSNRSIPSARPSIQPEIMPISKKRGSTHAISAVTSNLDHTLARDMICIRHMLKYFWGARTYYDILGVREHAKIF